MVLPAASAVSAWAEAPALSRAGSSMATSGTFDTSWLAATLTARMTGTSVEPGARLRQDRLEEARVPHAAHQHEHGRKEHEGAPVEVPDQRPAAAACQQQGGRSSQRDQGQGKVPGPRQEREDHLGGDHREGEPHGEAAQASQRRVADGGLLGCRGRGLAAVEEAQQHGGDEQVQQGRQGEPARKGDKGVRDPAGEGDEQVLRIADRTRHAADGDGEGQGQEHHLRAAGPRARATAARRGCRRWRPCRSSAAPRPPPSPRGRISSTAFAERTRRKEARGHVGEVAALLERLADDEHARPGRASHRGRWPAAPRGARSARSRGRAPRRPASPARCAGAGSRCGAPPSGRSRGRGRRSGSVSSAPAHANQRFQLMTSAGSLRTRGLCSCSLCFSLRCSSGPG